MLVDRFLDRTELRFTVRFITPTFLGGADKNAEIRVAPFKYLLRRWWRILNGSLSSQDVGEKEAMLFGSVNGKDARASSVRISIIGSSIITNSEPIQLGILHEAGGMNVPASTYLGYGLFKPPRNYIEANSTVKLVITIPRAEEETFKSILFYINFAGTIGSRCRNGWGSIQIEPEGFVLIKKLDNSIDMGQVLEKSYPTGFCHDKKGQLCVWYSKKANAKYEETMLGLGTLYQELCKELKELNARYLLGYPVTKGTAISSNEIKRIPSPVILKIAQLENKKYYGKVILLPCKNGALHIERDKEIALWEKVITFFDTNESLKRN